MEVLCLFFFCWEETTDYEVHRHGRYKSYDQSDAVVGGHRGPRWGLMMGWARHDVLMMGASGRKELDWTI